MLLHVGISCQLLHCWKVAVSTRQWAAKPGCIIDVKHRILQLSSKYITAVLSGKVASIGSMISDADAITVTALILYIDVSALEYYFMPSNQLWDQLGANAFNLSLTLEESARKLFPCIFWPGM